MSDIEQVAEWTMECAKCEGRGEAYISPGARITCNDTWGEGQSCGGSGQVQMFPTIMNWVMFGYIREPNASVLLNDVLKRVKELEWSWWSTELSFTLETPFHGGFRSHAGDSWDDLLSCLAQAKTAMEAKK